MADLHIKPHAEADASASLLALQPRRGETESRLAAAMPGRMARADLVENALYRRAVEAAIWGVPLVNFHALRQAYFSDAGARLNDVIFWSEPAGWKFQAPVPEPSARLVLFFLNAEEGPMVVEIPAAGKAELSGTLVDSWNLPMADVGPTGADKGKGAKYLLLPPEQDARHAMGFLPVRAATHNICGLLRLTPRTESDEDVDEAIAYLKQIRIYPLSGGGPTRRQRFIDMAFRKFEGTIAWDASFFSALARMVGEEPIKPRDLSMMGLLHTIGIGRDRALHPDEVTAALFGRAVAEAHAFMADGRRRTSAPTWPDRQWCSRAIAGDPFALDDRVQVDARAFACVGSLGLRRDATGERHFETFVDERGEPLHGSRAYRLTIPADLDPPGWSVAAYDAETGAFIREASKVGFDSREPALERNEGGSVDLHFAPNPPRSRETNWIATAEDRPFFLIFRRRLDESSVDVPLRDVEPFA